MVAVVYQSCVALHSYEKTYFLLCLSDTVQNFPSHIKVKVNGHWSPETLHDIEDESIRVNVLPESNLEKLNFVIHDNVNLKVTMDTPRSSTANNISSSEVENLIQRLQNENKKMKIVSNVYLMQKMILNRNLRSL